MPILNSLGKNIYWYENSRKQLGAVILQGNYIILIAQDKNRRLNITSLNNLADVGISPYNFLKIIPDDVTNFNISGALKTITDLVISGFIINRIDIFKDAYVQNSLTSYYMIVDKLLDEVDNMSINTAQTRIFFNCLKKINDIKIETKRKSIPDFFLLEIYNDLLSFSLNINDYTIIDCNFLQYCINDYIKSCDCLFAHLSEKSCLKKELFLCLGIIDKLLISQNDDEYMLTIDRLHKSFANIKKCEQNTIRYKSMHLID